MLAKNTINNIINNYYLITILPVPPIILEPLLRRTTLIFIISNLNIAFHSLAFVIRRFLAIRKIVDHQIQATHCLRNGLSLGYLHYVYGAVFLVLIVERFYRRGDWFCGLATSDVESADYCRTRALRIRKNVWCWNFYVLFWPYHC